MRLFGRRRTVEAVRYDDDGTLVTLAISYDVTVGDSGAVAALPPGEAVLVRQVFAGVAEGDLPALAEMAAEEGWGEPEQGDGRTVVRSTRVLTPLTAAQQRARMTTIAYRLGVDYLGWEAALPAPPAPPAPPDHR